MILDYIVRQKYHISFFMYESTKAFDEDFPKLPVFYLSNDFPDRYYGIRTTGEWYKIGIAKKNITAVAMRQRMILSSPWKTTAYIQSIVRVRQDRCIQMDRAPSKHFEKVFTLYTQKLNDDTIMIYAGTATGLYSKQMNYPSPWMQVASIGGFPIYSIVAKNRTEESGGYDKLLFALSINKLYTSLDYGTTWAACSVEACIPDNKKVMAIPCFSTHVNLNRSILLLVAAVSDSASMFHCIIKSPDNGRHWSIIASNYKNPTNGFLEGCVSISIDGQNRIYCASSDGLYISTDSTATVWKKYTALDQNEKVRVVKCFDMPGFDFFGLATDKNTYLLLNNIIDKYPSPAYSIDDQQYNFLHIIYAGVEDGILIHEQWVDCKESPTKNESPPSDRL